MNFTALLILAGALFVSLLFNIFFIWYLKNTLSRLLFVSDNLGDLMDYTISFREHLESVHEMEMFYGDETLGSLIRHAREYSETLSEFEEIYTLSPDDEENQEEIYADDEEYQYQEERIDEYPTGTEEEKRKKRTKRLYFTQVHEDAIVEYVATNSLKRKNRTLCEPNRAST